MTSPEPVLDGLATRLRVATMRLARRLRHEGQLPVGLTQSQLSALSSIELKGPLTLGELASWEKVQPPSMTRVVAALVELGLVDRETDPSDARVFRLTVSAEGAARIADIRVHRDEWIEDRLRDFSREEVHVLARAVDVLQRMADS